MLVKNPEKIPPNPRAQVKTRKTRNLETRKAMAYAQDILHVASREAKCECATSIHVVMALNPCITQNITPGGSRRSKNYSTASFSSAVCGLF